MRLPGDDEEIVLLKGSDAKITYYVDDEGNEHTVFYAYMNNTERATEIDGGLEGALRKFPGITRNLEKEYGK